MRPDQRNRIVISQREALKRNGFHPNALFWSSKEVQEKRFQVFAKSGIQSADTLLDIGCGFGDFADYLKQKNILVEYTGIDISKDLLQVGKQHYPEIILQEADLFEFNPQAKSYDYVMLSGALNRKFMGNKGAESASDYSFQIIRRMFETCKKGIAFNLLDARHSWTAERWDLQSFHPDEIIAFIRDLTCHYQLVDDYLENDFTVYAWRKDEFKPKI